MPKRKSGFQVEKDFSGVMYHSESAGKAVAITTMHYFHLLNAMRKVKDSTEFIKTCVEYLHTVKVAKADKAKFDQMLSEFTS